MMYFKLVKVFFKENFSLDRLLGSGIAKSKIKSVLLGFVIVFGLGSVLFSFGLLFFQLGAVFKATDSLDSLLTYIFMYGTFMSSFFIILRSSGYLFHYKDYDFLSSLPIKNEVVLAAKITVMMLMIYLSTYVLTSPIIFSYLYHSGFSVYQLFAILVLILFIPMIPLVIFSFIALLIYYVVTKFRLGKILGAILTFGLLLAYMYFVFSFNAETENPFTGQNAFLDSVSRFIPTARLFYQAVAETNILSFLGLIIINAGILVAYIYLVKGLVNYTNQRQINVMKRKNRHIKYKQNSIYEAIIKKEVRKFFSVNIYLLNSGFGPILMIVGGILSFVYVDSIQSFLAQMVGVPLQMELLVLLVIGFFITTVFTSSISLSLEGENFWIIRTLPIKASTVMIGKMLFNVLLGLPAALFLAGALTFSMGIDIVTILVMMIFIASFSLVTSIFGSVINLYFPKFHFKNETEVVKQSAGAILGMFSGWILMIGFGLLHFYVMIDLPLIGAILIYSTINILCFILAYIFINKKAESIFMTYS